MKPLRGLKKAVGEYQKNHKTWLCVIYLDIETEEVWAFTYSDEAVINQRFDKSVHDLNTHIQDATGSTAVNMESIRKTAEYVRKLYQ